MFSCCLALSSASVTASRPCHVSSPRHLERSVWISRSTLSCLFHPKVYRTYPAGATGTGKTHIATALGRRPSITSLRLRFFSSSTRRTRSKTEKGNGPAGSPNVCAIDLVVLDELGYLPFAQAGGQLLSTC